jgi:hypothetical protein
MENWITEQNKDGVVSKRSPVIYTLVQRVVSQYTEPEDWTFDSHHQKNIFVFVTATRPALSSTVSHQQMLGALS